MYSFSYLEPVCCSMSSSDCCFLTCVQTSQEAGQVVWYSHLFQNFLQFVVIYTVKGFGIVNKTEVEVFLELCFLMIQQMLAIWSLVLLSFLKPAWTSVSSWFTYCCGLAWRILSITNLWDECNCAVVWAFFGIAFLWDWNENWPFPVLCPLLCFPNLLAYECSSFTTSSFRIWNSSTGTPSPPLASFIMMFPKAHLTSHSRMSCSRWVVVIRWFLRWPPISSQSHLNLQILSRNTPKTELTVDSQLVGNPIFSQYLFEFPQADILQVHCFDSSECLLSHLISFHVLW